MWVRRRWTTSTAACGQDQSCEGSNPMSDAATASRGMAEQDRPIAEHRLEGNGRCMMGRSTFAAIFGSAQSRPLGRRSKRQAKNRRDERLSAAALGQALENDAGGQVKTSKRDRSNTHGGVEQRGSASFAEGNKTSREASRFGLAMPREATMAEHKTARQCWADPRRLSGLLRITAS